MDIARQVPSEWSRLPPKRLSNLLDQSDPNEKTVIVELEFGYAAFHGRSRRRRRFAELGLARTPR